MENGRPKRATFVVGSELRILRVFQDAGASLGQVRRIDEATQASQPVPIYSAALAEKTPIEPGTQDLQATVTVTFSLA